MDHFLQFPYCQNCGEQRIVCLQIHHVHGKHEVNVLETLCSNCHLVFHAKVSGAATYTEEMEKKAEKDAEAKAKKERNIKIKELIASKDLTYSQVGELFNLSSETIRKIAKS